MLTCVFVNIGERLRALRHLVTPPMSLRELARIIGVSPAYPGLIESRKEADIGATVAVSIAKTFGATVGYLVTGDGKPPTRKQAEAAVAQARAEQGPDTERAAS